MRGTVAKRIRKQIYGEDLAPRARKYRGIVRRIWEDLKGKKEKCIELQADPYRREYQSRKRMHRPAPARSKVRFSRRLLKKWQRRRATSQ